MTRVTFYFSNENKLEILFEEHKTAKKMVKKVSESDFDGSWKINSDKPTRRLCFFVLPCFCIFTIQKQDAFYE